MTSCFVSLKHKQSLLRPACLAAVSLAAAFASGDRVHAASARKETAVASIESPASRSWMRDQRITFYDKNGWIRDIAPVASIACAPNVMEVSLSVPVKTVPEFIACAEANPGKVNMASGGVGSGNRHCRGN
jgi:hypothetical protein